MEARARKEGAEGTTAVKPMTSQVNWAILGLLIERPGYGSQLQQRLAQDYADVLSLNSESHVYTALNELERRGLIEEVPGTWAKRSGTRRQPKVEYRAAAEGVGAYRDWMFTQAWEDRRNSRLFARLLAVLAREPQVALEILARYEAACLRETRRAGGSGDSPRRLADRLVAEDSRLAVEGRLPWAQFARQAFETIMGGGLRR